MNTTRLPVAGLGALGAGAVVAGAFLPWLSTYAGLVPLRAVSGSFGKALVLIGVVAALSSVVHLVSSRAWPRWTVGLLGFAAALLSGWMLTMTLRTLGDLRAEPLVVASLGPGGLVSLAGAVVVLGTLLLREPAAPDRATTRTAARANAGSH